MSHGYLLRPPLSMREIQSRGQTLLPKEKRAIRKALITLHNLELMAVTIYQYQITRKAGPLNELLIASMCNEMTHYQDFQVKLYEFGFRPHPLRLFWWLVGAKLGLFSRLLGKTAILKLGMWVEKKAVRHYSHLIHDIPWDDVTLSILQKDQQDEETHIQHFQEMLKKT